jgi:hypothetical protein
MEKIIVSYQKEWGRDGACYTQTVKISHDLFLSLATKIQDEIQGGFSHYCDYAFRDMLKAECYLQPLDTKEKKHFLTLTQLRFIYLYLRYSCDTARLKLDRNTILEVVAHVS